MNARNSYVISRRQLGALFATSLVQVALAGGLLPLLPVVARVLGASPEVIGIYLAIAYAASAVGTVAAGWFTDRFGRRKLLLVVVGFAASPVTATISLITSFLHLVVLTAVVWFLIGMGLTLVNILAGLSAGPKERGRVFGILIITWALGALIGGATVGPFVDRVGYLPAFAFLGLAFLLCPLAALFVVEEVPAPRPATDPDPRRARNFPTAFLLLVAASVLVGVAIYVGVLGRSLAMDRLGYTATAITSTVAVAGLMALPIAPSVGILSDRLGRLGFLALGYVTVAVGLVIFAVASSLWNFCVANGLVSILPYAFSSVGSALVTDLVPPDSLGRGMSLYSATMSVGAVVGFLGTGAAFAALGASNTFLGGAALVVLALLLLIPVRGATKKRAAETASAGC